MAKVKNGATKTELRKHTQEELEAYSHQLDEEVQEVRAEAKRVQEIISEKVAKAREEILAAATELDQEVKP